MLFDFCSIQKSLSSCSLSSIHLFDKIFFRGVESLWMSKLHGDTHHGLETVVTIQLILSILFLIEICDKKCWVVVRQRPHQYSMALHPYLPHQCIGLNANEWHQVAFEANGTPLLLIWQPPPAMSVEVC